MFTREFFEGLLDRITEQNATLKRMVQVEIFKAPPVVVMTLRDGTRLGLSFLHQPLEDNSILTAVAYKDDEGADLKVVCIPYEEIVRVEAFEPDKKGRTTVGFQHGP